MVSLSRAAYDVPVTGEPFTGTLQQGVHSYYCLSSAIWSIHVSRLTGCVLVYIALLSLQCCQAAHLMGCIVRIFQILQPGYKENLTKAVRIWYPKTRYRDLLKSAFWGGFWLIRAKCGSHSLSCLSDFVVECSHSMWLCIICYLFLVVLVKHRSLWVFNLSIVIILISRDGGILLCRRNCSIFSSQSTINFIMRVPIFVLER